MIVRICEAHAKPGRVHDLRRFIVEATKGFPEQYEGFAGYEILVDETADVLLWVSRWRTEAALVDFAGPRWRSDPVVLPEEKAFLTVPLTVRHFVATDRRSA